MVARSDDGKGILIIAAPSGVQQAPLTRATRTTCSRRRSQPEQTLTRSRRSSKCWIPLSARQSPPRMAQAAGTLTLTEAWDTPLEPAPITPFGEDSAPWQLLSGTIKATFNAHRGLDGADNIFVSPGITTGNTGGCTFSCLPVIRARSDVNRYEVVLEPHAPHNPV
jgi:hypothetical protein